MLHERFGPQLFDMINDPHEYRDLGNEPGLESIRDDMRDLLFAWLRRRRSRTEVATDRLFDLGPERDEQLGILIGRW